MERKVAQSGSAKGSNPDILLKESKCGQSKWFLKNFVKILADIEIYVQTTVRCKNLTEAK